MVHQHYDEIAIFHPIDTRHVQMQIINIMIDMCGWQEHQVFCTVNVNFVIFFSFEI